MVNSILSVQVRETVEKESLNIGEFLTCSPEMRANSVRVNCPHWITGNSTLMPMQVQGKFCEWKGTSLNNLEFHTYCPDKREKSVRVRGRGPHWMAFEPRVYFPVSDLVVFFACLGMHNIDHILDVAYNKTMLIIMIFLILFKYQDILLKLHFLCVLIISKLKNINKMQI